MNFSKLIQKLLLLNCIFYTSDTIQSCCCGKESVQIKEDLSQGSDLNLTESSTPQITTSTRRETNQDAESSVAQRNNNENNPLSLLLSQSLVRAETSQLSLNNSNQNSAELLANQNRDASDQSSNSTYSSQDSTSNSSNSDTIIPGSILGDIRRENQSSFNSIQEALYTPPTTEITIPFRSNLSLNASTDNQ